MIGLDTNVLVRHIAQDDPKQSAKATKLIESLTTDVPG
jgi:predicted nucleic-acid-binding protein